MRPQNMKRGFVYVVVGLIGANGVNSFLNGQPDGLWYAAGSAAVLLALVLERPFLAWFQRRRNRR